MSRLTVTINPKALKEAFDNPTPEQIQSPKFRMLKHIWDTVELTSDDWMKRYEPEPPPCPANS
jgi:hypothetical protein